MPKRKASETAPADQDTAAAFQPPACIQGAGKSLVTDVSHNRQVSRDAECLGSTTNASCAQYFPSRIQESGFWNTSHDVTALEGFTELTETMASVPPKPLCLPTVSAYAEVAAIDQLFEVRKPPEASDTTVDEDAKLFEKLFMITEYHKKGTEGDPFEPVPLKEVFFMEK